MDDEQLPTEAMNGQTTHRPTPSDAGCEAQPDGNCQLNDDCQLPIEKGLSIEIDEGSGFCFGVTTAIGKAEEELSRHGSLYCLGDIVHNGRECDRLRRLGLVTIDHAMLSTLPAGSRVLLRAHGEPPATYALAAARGIELIDATCPVVLGLQRRIRQVHEARPDAQIAIYGKPGHAEVLGLVGQTDGRAVVIETPDEAAERLDPRRDVYLFSQTTKPLEGFSHVVARLAAHVEPPARFRSFDTICRQVANRLPHIRRFAARHDVVLFVCGRKSSNGRVLYEAARDVNPCTHLVEGPADLQSAWFDGARSVGICGATSTPKWLMEQCRDALLETE